MIVCYIFTGYFNYCDNSGEGSDGDAAPFKGGFYSNTLSKIIGHARERKVLVVAVVEVEVVEETAGLCTNYLVAFPATTLKIMLQRMPITQTNGICQFSLTNPNMTICVGIQKIKFRFQHGKKLCFAL